MTQRRRLRRRLLWAGVLFGLVLLLAVVSALRVALWAGRAVNERGEGMLPGVRQKARGAAVAAVAMLALALPVAAVGSAEQFVIPIDDPAAPWEFDDPCTGEAVHGLGHETGQARITDLGEQGVHVRLRVEGRAELLDDEDELVGTWTYRMVFTDQIPPDGQGAVQMTAIGPIQYVTGGSAVLHVFHHQVFDKGDVERFPARDTAVCGGKK
jgi:hypothetical protein